MSLRTTFVAAIGALALFPAAGLAVERETTLSADQPEFKWTTAEQTGAVYGSDVSSQVPACSAAFSCDSTLVQTDRYGNLEVSIAGKGVQGQPTLEDVDLHVYVSNANGTQGELLGEGVTAESTENVVLDDLPAGFYLVYIDWYLGAGSVDGTAKLSDPTTPADPENPPVFTPAEEVLTPVTFSRTVDLASPATPKAEWSKQGAGLSDLVSSGGPCSDATCDYTLIKVGEAGLLTLTSKADQPTIVDGDIQLFRSNAEGGLGENIGAATAFTPDETLALEVDPGYYLYRFQFSGAGSYTGTAALSASEVVEE